MHLSLSRHNNICIINISIILDFYNLRCHVAPHKDCSARVNEVSKAIVLLNILEIPGLLKSLHDSPGTRGTS